MTTANTNELAQLYHEGMTETKKKKNQWNCLTYHRCYDESQHNYDDKQRYKYTSPISLTRTRRHQLQNQEQNETKHLYIQIRFCRAAYKSI